MVADPFAIPFTTVPVRPELVSPCGMKKLPGNTVATEVLLDASVINTPPTGAAVPNETVRVAELPTVTFTVDGSTIPPAGSAVTVTPAVVGARPGAVAVMVTDPAAMPVTGTDAVVAPVAKFTVAGTVATAALLELRLTASAAVAGAESFSVRF